MTLPTPFALGRHALRFLSLVLCVQMSGMVDASGLAGTAERLPDFQRVDATLETYFNQQKGYIPGDLITRKQVAEVLDEIQTLGWKLPDRAKFEKRAVDDGSFLAGQLKSPSGKKFMRQIASMPLAYDRLDRLAELPQGRSTVERLVRGPDGYKLLEYMTGAKGGHELTRMLSKDGGGDFDRATGKIYTAEQLRTALKDRHAKATADALARTGVR
jgi:hypothetical protein